MRDPDFMIIGVQKGGTESAIKHLNQHNDLKVYEHEIHYFDQKKEIYEYSDISEYKKKFINLEGKLVGEKTPSYVYLRFAINRIYKTYPNMKLIILLREPISRAYSEWNMFMRYDGPQFIKFRRSNENNRDFIKSIKEIENIELKDIKENNYWALQRGYYIDQIEYILTKFSRENVKIMISEQIIKDPLNKYNEIFEFLGLEKLEKIDFKEDIHKLQYTRPITYEEFKFMYNKYKNYNKRLYNFLGKEIEEWKEIYRKYGLE